MWLLANGVKIGQYVQMLCNISALIWVLQITLQHFLSLVLKITFAALFNVFLHTRFYFIKKIMIQRIQSIYLLLLIIAFSSLFFIPLSSISITSTGSMQVQVLSVTGLKVFEGDILAKTTPQIILMIVALTVMAIALITIFCFKNRKLQMLLCKLIMVTVIIFILLAFKQTDGMAVSANTKAIYQAGAYISIVSLLFVYLALNGIKKDEELVRSADRLR